MPLLTGTPGNVIAGYVTCYVAQLTNGVAQAPPATTGSTLTWTGWTPVGFTEQGLKESWDPKTTDFIVEEQMTPVDVGVDSLDIQWTLTLAEDTLTNAALAKGNSGVLTVTNAGVGQVALESLALGDSITKLSVGFEGVNRHGFWRMAYIPYAISVGKVETDYRRAKQYRMYPLTFRALCDPTDVITTDMTAVAT